MRTTAVVLTVIFLVACSKPETAAARQATTATVAHVAPPTVDQARQIVEASPEFSEYEFTNASWTLPLDHKLLNDQTKKSAKELAAAGWVGFDGDGNPVITAKAKSDRRFLVRANGFADIVPIAKKEFGAVSAVRALPEGKAAVDFDWRWVPNDVGTSFKSGPVRARFDAVQQATATLMVDAGGAWTVLRIEARP